MKRPLRLVSTATVTAAVALLLGTQSGLADPLGVTHLNTPVITQYPADGGSVVAIPIQLTNNNTYGVEILSLGSLSSAYDEGNPGDVVTGVSFDNDGSGNSSGNCFAYETLKKSVNGASGGSCTLEVLLTVTGVAPTKLPPDDLGVSLVTDAGIIYTGGSDFGGPQHMGVEFGVEVQETDAPEPGSLILFGTGLLGLAVVMRRKFSHS